MVSQGDTIASSHTEMYFSGKLGAFLVVGLQTKSL
jgi:hypothetical protein